MEIIEEYKKIKKEHKIKIDNLLKRIKNAVFIEKSKDNPISIRSIISIKDDDIRYTRFIPCSTSPYQEHDTRIEKFLEINREATSEEAIDMWKMHIDFIGKTYKRRMGL